MKVKPYVVRRGDTLAALARFFGITLMELIDENPLIVNPNLIRIGEIILVPDIDSSNSVHAFLAKENISIDVPPWFQVALREEGVTEIPGPANNPKILEYHITTSLDRDLARKDSTAWCSSFVNWCMEQVESVGTDSAWAKSWNNWQLKLEVPRIGCVVVFSRDTATKSGGHVGFFIGENDTSIEVLGGNQGDKVSRLSFPKKGRKGAFYYKLLSYRWPYET